MGDNTTDFSSRVLCSDGTCIGVIGTDGKCKECGKPSGQVNDTVHRNNNITKTKNIISHVSVDENDFKCKTCGFIAFGDDPSTAKHQKCLGCGNIMGDEPIKKQPSSASDSLLETCQNCKHQFSQRASKCPKCQKERTSPCFVCKKQIPQSSKYCPECGDPGPFEQTTEKIETTLTKKNGNVLSKEKTSYPASTQMKPQRSHRYNGRISMEMLKRLSVCFVAWLVTHFTLYIGFAFVTENPPPGGLIALIDMCVAGYVFYLTRDKDKSST